MESSQIFPQIFSHTGRPDVNVIDNCISELDNQLDDNMRDIDNCMQDILRYTNNLPSRKSYSHPRDAVQEMQNSHVLEKDSCYDPDMEEVSVLLNHVASILASSPGIEEILLEELLTLSSKEGISLPLCGMSVDAASASLASLNATDDDSEQLIANQWEQIALHFRRYFVDHLSKLPTYITDDTLNIFEDKRIDYLQSLMALYPPEEVWKRYKSVRQLQLDRCFNTLLAEEPEKQYNFSDVASNCKELAKLVVCMVDEDFSVINSGVLKKSINIFRSLHEMYLEKFTDEMSALVDEIWEELMEKLHIKKPSLSASEQGIYDTLQRKLSKGKARSLESLMKTSATDLKGPSASDVLRKCIESMIEVVKSILFIHDHLEVLYKMITWDVSGVSSKKHKHKGSLKGVLKSSSPEVQRRPLSVASTDSGRMSPDLSQYTVQQENLDGTAVPKVVEKSKSEDRPKWNWKMIFKRIDSEFSKYIEQYIREFGGAIAGNEKIQWERTYTLTTVRLDELLHGGKLNYPKIISQGTRGLMDTFDLLLPLGKAALEGALLKTRTVFVETMTLSLKNFHLFLSKAASEIPSKSVMSNLYVILSNTVYIKNQLQHYDNVLTIDESSKKTFTNLHKQFDDLSDAITKQIVTLHTTNISASLLHDAESNHWADSKEFWEDERCSFTVQMWNYYLRCMQHDLWSICPPKASQQMLCEILHESLFTLTQRYVKVQPTCRRTNQFRNDILTILLCTSELIYNCCDSVSKLIDPYSSQQHHYAIHNLCSTLFSAMSVVCAPLDALYKTFKRGFHFYCHTTNRDHMGFLTDRVQGCNTNWLCWIHPNIYQFTQKHFDEMQTTTALYLLIKIMMSQPDINFGFIVQSLVMKDYTLSILLLTRTQDQMPHGSSAGYTAPTDSAVISVEQVGKRLFHAVTQVLCHCDHFVDGLAKVIIPVIERSDDWNCLGPRSMRENYAPLWLSAVLDLLEPFVLRLMKPVLTQIVTEKPNISHPSLLSVLTELPCGCQFHCRHTARNKKHDDPKATVDRSLKKIIQQLSADISLLPISVCVLFKTLQEECKARGIRTNSCIGLQILARCIRDRLCNNTYIESVTKVRLNQGQQENLNMISESLYHVLVGKTKDIETPRLARAFNKGHKEWLLEKIKKVTNFLNCELFEPPESTLLDDGTLDYSEQLFKIASSNILEIKSGYQYLMDVYRIISNNQAWLEEQLDIQSVLPKRKVTVRKIFNLSVEKQTEEPYTPLDEFDKIGETILHHETIRAYPLNWGKILQSDLGLSETGFRNLLFNRHEMQDGAYLEEQEKKPVKVLKSIFEAGPSELC